MYSLPPCLSNFVFCQYSVWGHNESVVVPPADDRTGVMGNLGAGDLQRQVPRQGEDVPIKFDHCKVYIRLVCRQEIRSTICIDAVRCNV